MVEAIRRNAIILAGMALAALACVLAAPALMSSRGSIVPAALLAERPLLALLSVTGALFVAALIAAAVGRMTNAAVGTFVLGSGLFVLAGRTHTVFEAARLEGLAKAPIELLLWTAIGAGALLMLFHLSGWFKDIEPTADDRRPHWLWSVEALKAAAAGALVLPAVWLLALTAMKGQVIAAVILGSVVAGLAGRLFSPHVQPVLLFLSPLVFGAAGHWFGLMQLDGGVSQADAAAMGLLSHLSLPMPLDYLAGTFIGAPIGYGWAKSFLQHEDDVDEHSAAVRIRRAT